MISNQMQVMQNLIVIFTNAHLSHLTPKTYLILKKNKQITILLQKYIQD
jgi:hypothetical protein